ncbi:hypothetical protein KIW84_065843 [Lathyrus oleraceus]|uniref:Uncharacterized protein n=1 Tax=Pisum sativum TaxID=3888 RepID=A0A9D5AD03_PEA|nr:hypothetical protein KIW84_065843 [Pisum sativum]
MPIPLFLHQISTLIVTSYSGSSLLGLSVLELAAICVNLTLVLLFLFIVSVRKILVNKRNRLGKDNTPGSGSVVIDTETTSDVSNISLWFKLSLLSCFYVLFVQLLVLGFDLCVSIWGEVLHWSVLSVSASRVLSWCVLSFSALKRKFKGGFWVDGSKYFSSHAVASFAVTPGLAFLGVVAVRGVTGIQVLMEEAFGCLGVSY